MSSQNHNLLSEKEHMELRERILTSANQLRRNRRKKRLFKKVSYISAACIVAFFGLVRIFQTSDESALENFITNNATTIDYSSQKNVTIVLSGGENLHLGEDEETVQYSKSGENVQIGSGKSYQQELSQNKNAAFNTILVPYGKRTDVLLSDGTKVWVNSGSKLVYPPVFSSESREVFLEGEAIFEVAHNPDKPFKVLSHHQEIEVLGTVFNVSTYPEDEEFQTVLKSGSVRITYNDDTQNSIKITPGTLSSYNTKTFEMNTRSVAVEDYFSWREGVLNLRNHTLEHITMKLSKYYNVEIYIFDENLRKETFSGKLDLKEDVYRVMSTISSVTSFKMKTQDQKIILTK